MNGTPSNVREGADIVVLDGSCALSPVVIGNKAWGVNRMCWLGLPVPPAFAVTTHACRDYFAAGRRLDDTLWDRIVLQVKALEEQTGRCFGAVRRPLLVSVRSGGAQSMPGMMDTVLNLGINAAIEPALAAETGGGRYAADTRARFLTQFRDVVLGGATATVPDDPWEQLRAAVAAVFDSWNTPRAIAYRRARGIPEDGYTAATVQAMVFGNRDERSGTGVLFSRSPITGDAPAWGEWLAQGQGEDVVSGRRTPEPLESLRECLPEAYLELMHATAVLEADARDIQDIEFTVESGRLWMLQTRTAKRSPQAAFHAAVSFAEEGIISHEEALRRVTLDHVQHLPVAQLSADAARLPPVAVGLPACPGVAHGIVVVEPDEAESRASLGVDVILARRTTSADDLHGLIAARAVATELGGTTSHAAVVSRELGRPCVVGCGPATVTSLAGREVTIDGTTGRVWVGNLSIERTGEESSTDARLLLEWGMPLLSMALVNDDEAPTDALDLDSYGDDWRAALEPGITVRGSILDTPVGIRAAYSAGVRLAVVRDRLWAMFACLQHSSSDISDHGPRPDEMAPTSSGPSELSLLRLAALKARATPEALAEALALPATAIGGLYESLREHGLCVLAGTSWRLTPAGRERMDRLLAEERATVHVGTVVKAYEAFRAFDIELKEIVTAFQIKPDGTANDHTDEAYDRAAVQRLIALHGRAGPLLHRLARLAPRLADYAGRLRRAAARIAAGDRAAFAGVVVDSYHSVWFALHTELISLVGTDRRSEA